jgi:hypothetical protein
MNYPEDVRSQDQEEEAPAWARKLLLRLSAIETRIRELITAGLCLIPDRTSTTILILSKEGPTVPVTITADQIQKALYTK